MNKCEYCQKPIDHFNEDYLVLYRTRRDEQSRWKADHLWIGRGRWLFPMDR